MFTITVRTNFKAAHQLTLSDGSREPVHTHNWLVSAEVNSEKLNNIGLVMDFHRLKGLLDGILAEFQDAALQKKDYFKLNSPSAENVARYVYEALEPLLGKNTKLQAVEVVEEAGCSARFVK